jgi:hypothetical protein
MIIVQVSTDSSGCLKQLSATGHSRLSEKGADILCAAVSFLLRTTAGVLRTRLKETLTVRAENPGQFNIGIRSYPDSEKEWFTGITDIVVSGFMDLQDEYPENIRLELTEED